MCLPRRPVAASRHSIPGDIDSARAVARRYIEAFAHVDYVVVSPSPAPAVEPSHYPELFKDDVEWADRARQMAARTFELTSLSHDMLA